VVGPPASLVYTGGNTYVCTVNHTSGASFATDLGAGKWAPIVSGGGGGGSTVYISDTAPVGSPANSLWWNSTNGVLYVYYNDGDSTQWVAAVPGASAASSFIRSFISGLTLSTAGSSTSFSVAAGVASDGTNVDMLSLASALSKTTGAWAVGTGNGALDTGTTAINTWYHVHLIKRSDTGVVDVLTSLSATSPVLPSGYGLFRRIGSMKTNASTQWTAFVQFGDEFLLSTPVQDANALAVSTSVVTLTLASVPTGAQVTALLNASSGGTAQSIIAASTTHAIASTTGGNFNVGAYGSQLRILTNTLAQINLLAASASNANVWTYGWADSRGRLA
jgi:hypothetical protein